MKISSSIQSLHSSNGHDQLAAYPLFSTLYLMLLFSLYVFVSPPSTPFLCLYASSPNYCLNLFLSALSILSAMIPWFFLITLACTIKVYLKQRSLKFIFSDFISILKNCEFSTLLLSNLDYHRHERFPHHFSNQSSCHCLCYHSIRSWCSGDIC